MAGPRKIRITKNDRTEYAKLAKNVKAKINRTAKKYGIDLSNEISTPKLNEFSSRKEFNEWKEKASSFTNRFNLNYQFKKNKYDVVWTKAQENKYKRYGKQAQEIVKNKNKEIGKLPIFKNGLKISTVGQRMGMLKGIKHTEAFAVPKLVDFDDVRQQSTIESLINGIREKASPEIFDKRSEKMRDVFADQMQWAMDMVGYDDQDKLVEFVRSMNPQDFYELYLQNEDMSFELFGSPRDLDEGIWLDPAQQLGGLGLVANILEKYKAGEIDRDFFHIPNK